MAAGERTVKIRFTGETKGLAAAAAGAKKIMGVFKKNVEDGADESTKGLGSFFTKAFSNPYVLGAVAVAALGLGQIAGAAIVAGLGIGALSLVLVAGIKGAAADPEVQQAWGGFTKKAGEAFKAFSEPFKGPVLAAIKAFSAGIDAMKPTFVEIGKAVAPLVEKLAPALVSLVKNALPGFQQFLTTSTPLLEIVAEKMPGLGKAIGDFFAKLSAGGPGAQQFLKDFFDFLIWVIPKLGSFLAWLSARFIDWRNGVIVVFNAVKSAWNSVYAFFKNIGDRLGTIAWNVAQAWQGFKDRAVASFNTVVGKVRSAVQTIESWWNRLKSLAAAPIRFAVSLFGGGGIPGLSGRASGGPVQSGTSYLVGERGPEVLTMGGQGGHITPNHALAGGGGQVLELVVDLGDGIRQVFRGEIRAHDRNLKRQTVQMAGAR